MRRLWEPADGEDASSSSSGSDEEPDRQPPPSRVEESESEEEVVPPTPPRADSPVGEGRVLPPLPKAPRTWKRRFSVPQEEALKVVFGDYIRARVEDVSLKIWSEFCRARMSSERFLANSKQKSWPREYAMK